jgi:hypothetical protein
MGIPKKQGQRLKKNKNDLFNNFSEEKLKTGFFNKYKEKVIDRENKKINVYKEASGSWVFFDRIIKSILDIVMWVIIAYFVYVWYTTRAQPIGCERISPSFCTNCFGTVKSVIGNGLNSINNISFFP